MSHRVKYVLHDVRLVYLTSSSCWPDASVVGGSPLGGLGAASLDQEVTKAALGAEMPARPEVERAVGPSYDPNKDESSVPAEVPDLLESSWMTGQELRAFTEFSACSGASAEIAELTAIKVGL